MITKWIGSICLLGAAVWWLLLLYRQEDSRRLLAQDLVEALCGIATAIRWRQSRLTEAMQEAEKNACAGHIFTAVGVEIRQGKTLQESWNTAVTALLPEELAQICGAIQWTGDEKQLLDALDYATQRIRRSEEQHRLEHRDKQRTQTAAILSLTVMLLVLLL